MGLGKDEQETVIRWDEQDKQAVIDVYPNTRIHKRLQAVGAEPTGKFHLHREVVGISYLIPASWIKINPPRTLTEKQRVELAERARKNLLSKDD